MKSIVLSGLVVALLVGLFVSVSASGQRQQPSAEMQQFAIEQITAYKIIKAGSLRDLESEVNRAIRAGWRPQAGVTRSGNEYLQPVVK